MIRRTRWRLTILYSSIIALTLLIMAGVFYLSFLRILRHHEETELKQLAEEALAFLREDDSKLLQRGEQPHFGKRAVYGPHDEQDEDDFGKEGHGKRGFRRDETFFLFFDSAGTLLIHSLDDEALTNWLQQELAQWPPENLQRVKWLFRESGNDGQAEQVYALMALPLAGRGESIGKERERGHSSYGTLGTLFVGEEVTDYWLFIQRMRTVLFVLALGLLVVAAFIGYVFSGRAMVPILKAYRQQQTFLADASHELRTPISIIQSSVEILDEIKPQIPPFHQRVLDDMADEVGRMGRLVRDLLFLARSDAGELELLKEPFDFREACRTVTERMNNVSRTKGVQLTCQTPELPVWVHGDRERLEQLLYILLDNAIKYTPEGGHVKVNLTSLPNGRIECVVQDTGIGIPAEDLPHIFERFYRVDKDRSRKLGGTGIGLSIADWIVKAHGGSIHVSSEVGKGTSFHIYLPGRQR